MTCQKWLHHQPSHSEEERREMRRESSQAVEVEKFINEAKEEDDEIKQRKEKKIGYS